MGEGSRGRVGLNHAKEYKRKGEEGGAGGRVKQHQFEWTPTG